MNEKEITKAERIKFNVLNFMVMFLRRLFSVSIVVFIISVVLSPIAFSLLDDQRKHDQTEVFGYLTLLALIIAMLTKLFTVYKEEKVHQLQ